MMQLPPEPSLWLSLSAAHGDAQRLYCWRKQAFHGELDTGEYCRRGLQGGRGMIGKASLHATVFGKGAKQ